MGLFSLFDAVSLSEPLASLNVLPYQYVSSSAATPRISKVSWFVSAGFPGFGTIRGFAVWMSHFGLLVLRSPFELTFFGGMMTSSSDMYII